MHASPELLRDVQTIRAASIRPLPITAAVRIARSASFQLEPGLEFLSGLEPYPCTVTGTFAGLDVTVQVSDDQDSGLGEDDVTGWFTGTYEPGCVQVRPGTCTPDGGGGAWWYRPSNYTLTSTREELRAAGMSRAVAEATYRAIVQEELQQDAARYWLGVTVTFSHDGEHLGGASLWGIGLLASPAGSGDGAAYLIEVAAELAHAALQEARDNAPAIAARLLTRASTITRLLGPGLPITARIAP